jgi:ketosteroid isomerase-like protein
MSQENVELVRRGFEAFNRGGGDAQASEAVLDPDVVWEVDVGAPDLDGIHHGRRAVRRWWRTWMADLKDVHIDVAELADGGEHVFADTSFAGRGRTSGIEVTARIFCAFTVRDGLIVRYHAFSDRQQALEAAGLRE